MNNRLSIILLLYFITNLCFSQTEFQEGYYVNRENQKIACFIKNEDWRNNPSEIQIRTNPQASVQTVTMDDILSFEIFENAKFIRKEVGIDRSSEQVSRMSNKRAPEFNQEVLLLKVVVEGNASLYHYQGSGVERFFYTSPTTKEPKQLIYKKFKVETAVDAYGNLLKANVVATNNEYQQQLYSELNCQFSSTQQFETLRYTKKSLTKYFKDYNKCSNSSYKTYGEIEEKFSFATTLRIGLNNSKLETDTDARDFRSVEFDGQSSVRLSTEFELLLPFNNNRWGIIVEPTYQSFNADDRREVTGVEGGFINAEVEYSSIELPIGLRHYFLFQNDVKLFINLSYVVDFASSSSKVTFTRNDDTIFRESSIDSNGNLALGAGLSFGDKLVIELRQHTGRNILTDVSSWDPTYRTFSFILGYTVFRTKN